MDKEQFNLNGHLHQWDGTRWTHDEEVCCKPEQPKPESPNEWTHKCSYLSHVDGKVTLTDRSLNCFLCGALGPGNGVREEPWWSTEPSDKIVGIWAHKHGRQNIFMPQWALECLQCGAKRPPTDSEIKNLTEWWAWMEQKALRNSDQDL